MIDIIQEYNDVAPEGVDLSKLPGLINDPEMVRLLAAQIDADSLLEKYKEYIPKEISEIIEEAEKNRQKGVNSHLSEYNDNK